MEVVDGPAPTNAAMVRTNISTVLQPEPTGDVVLVVPLTSSAATPGRLGIGLATAFFVLMERFGLLLL